MPPLEIERKFLIRMPERDVLLAQAACTCSEIEQTYLQTEVPGISERVRARTTAGVTVYTHTVKTRVNPLTCIEEEETVSEEQYRALLERADASRSPVLKERFCFPRDGYLYEIDVYPFWTDRAIMEVELSSETEQFPIPSILSVLKEVTADKRYKNTMLAKSVPMDRIS